MCIICIKSIGLPLPSEEILENMWYGNPDGAGFMYAANGFVNIEKGFMTYTEFRNALKNIEEKFDITKIPLIMHCRITTHGGTKPENCHPFPITDNIGMITKLKCRSDWGVAHNGILDIKPRTGISDTMEYVLSQLSLLRKINRKFMEQKYFKQLVANATAGSRMAFMDSDGRIFTTGNWVEDGGYYYSNSNYKYSYSLRYGSNYSYNYGCGWDYGYDECEDTKLMSVCTLEDAEMYLYDIKNGKYIDDYPEMYDFYIDKDENVYKYNIQYDALVKTNNYELIRNLSSRGWSNKRATIMEVMKDTVVEKGWEICECCGAILPPDEQLVLYDGSVVCEECALEYDLVANKKEG